MFTIEYEQSLVETAVFLAVRNDERWECALHQIIDRLYEIPDEELRQREFAPVFRDFFTKLGFDRLIAGLLAERPLIAERVDRCVVREAPRKKGESAELLVQDKNCADRCVRRTLVIQMCPQSFLDTVHHAAPATLDGSFAALMRRELLHVADMLDDRFGYVREVFSGEPSRQNLQRDRYRVLWDIYVEGRLDREGHGVTRNKDRLLLAFGRVFADGTAGMCGQVFTRLLGAATLTHRGFMEWARDPAPLFASPLEPGRVAVCTPCSHAASES